MQNLRDIDAKWGLQIGAMVPEMRREIESLLPLSVDDIEHLDAVNPYSWAAWCKAVNAGRRRSGRQTQGGDSRGWHERMTGFSTPLDEVKHYIREATEQELIEAGERAGAKAGYIKRGWWRFVGTIEEMDIANLANQLRTIPGRRRAEAIQRSTECKRKTSLDWISMISAGLRAKTDAVTKASTGSLDASSTSGARGR